MMVSRLKAKQFQRQSTATLVATCRISEPPRSSMATNGFDLTCGIDLRKYRTKSFTIFR